MADGDSTPHQDESESKGGRAATASGARRVAGLLLWLLPLGLLALVAWIGYSALEDQPPAPAPPQASSGAWPRTVVEPSGRKVVIPRRPERIIAGESGSADVFSEILDPSRLAAIPAQADRYAGNQSWFSAHPELRRFQVFNAETLLSYKPDLVVCAAFQDAGTVRTLEEAGVPVLRLEAFHSWDEIRAWIDALGKATGEDVRAGALIERCEARLEAVRKAVAGRPRPRVLAYSNYNGSGIAAGAGETQDEIIRRAGGINAAAEAGFKGFGPFTYEQMLKLKPDVIVVSGDEGLESRQAKFLLSEPLLASVPAIANRRIAAIPGRYYDSTTQFLVDGVERLAKQLHPDAFRAAEKPSRNKDAQP